MWRSSSCCILRCPLSLLDCSEQDCGQFLVRVTTTLEFQVPRNVCMPQHKDNVFMTALMARTANDSIKHDVSKSSSAGVHLDLYILSRSSLVLK